MDIFETVKKTIVDICSINEEIVTADASIDNLGIDSFDVVDVISALEDEFEITISDEEIEGIETVQNIVDIIEKLS